jgi:hypothetical protein
MSHSAKPPTLPRCALWLVWLRRQTPIVEGATSAFMASSPASEHLNATWAFINKSNVLA